MHVCEVKALAMSDKKQTDSDAGELGLAGEELSTLRNRIDEIDLQIGQLISERAN